MPLDKPLPYETINEGEAETSRTYYIDWDEGRIIGFVDGVEAMRQFIKKALITPRFKYLIYDSQYGSEIKDILLDKESTREYIETESPFLIEDTLIHDERILKVYNVEITFGNEYPLQNSAVITLDVDTIYGEIPIEEVV